jgi:hypothetical protein
MDIKDIGKSKTPRLFLLSGAFFIIFEKVEFSF